MQPSEVILVTDIDDDARPVAVRVPRPRRVCVRDEAYYRRACALLDGLFGEQFVAEMSPEVRAAFERLDGTAARRAGGRR